MPVPVVSWAHVHKYVTAVTATPNCKGILSLASETPIFILSVADYCYSYSPAAGCPTALSPSTIRSVLLIDPP